MTNLQNEISQSIHNFTQDMMLYSSYCVNFHFLPKWKQIVVKANCSIVGHKMVDRKYGNSYCKKCLCEKVKEKIE